MLTTLVSFVQKWSYYYILHQEAFYSLKIAVQKEDGKWGSSTPQLLPLGGVAAMTHQSSFAGPPGCSQPIPSLP